MSCRVYLVLFLFSFVVYGCTTSRSEVRSSSEIVVPMASVTPSNQWKKAVFEGIRVGEDDRSVAHKVFGKPFGSGPPEGDDPKQPEIWDQFRINGEIHNWVTVMSLKNTGRIVMIVSHPKELSFERAKEVFGQDFLRSRYSIKPCGSDPSDGPLQPSTDGPFEFIEFREAGIAITLDASGTRVRDIEFRSDPVDVDSNECN